ncbi:MAG: protein-export membrane protein SecF [Candidatus Sungbacteria bacterium RIFCSPHIGHO2_02_FULL_52_23]|uniref:Protein-export membrane protein SecF n=1 Tax=Candidatus Sungbacteria bacterium RIFCSPHIGHO2_02_FULL_52_23 TaxID=1802274 RepID=A0A1G2KV70_9BACT|nr:MAG: protein-export membrane protein SecF [Candidatus Sungbacteria bacterium RIFCSPHIGHO2_02_FULL_52_23]
MNIIGRKYIFLTFSGLLVLASFVSLGIWGLHFGIDFTGGSLIEISYQASRPPVELVREQFTRAGVDSATIQFSGEQNVIARFRDVDESTHQKLVQGLGSLGAMQEKRFDAIGPTIGAQFQRRALLALALALAGIVLYLTWAFRQVSRPLASWKYGTVAVAVALFHDIVIPVGVFSVLGHYFGAEVDTLFITALLTILGFSVHDTIVVFDRTRENLRMQKSTESFAATVNKSVNETITRSIMTSLTVFLVLAAILFLGGATTKYFALALMLGVVFGTYSSIFVASPLLVIWDNWHRRWV